MEVIIKGTKDEIKELLAEIRKREYISVPSPITLNPCEPYWRTNTTTRPEDIKTTYTTTTGSTMGDGYAKGGAE